MKDVEFRSNIVRVYLTRPAHRKNGFIVPIIEDNGRFQTGQDLTYEQMIGKEPLSKEQKEKYPFVINPEVQHKLKHNINMDINQADARAIISLALISNYIAKSKAEYNSGHHEGYVIDKENDAIVELDLNIKIAKAFEIISNTKTEDINILCTLVSLQNNSPSLDDAISEKQKISALYKIAKELPDNIINCSAEHNPKIEDEMFVAYCVKHNLIRKRGNSYALYENNKEVALLGTTMMKTIAFLEGNPVFKDRLYSRLQEVEPFYQVNIKKVVASTGGIDTETLKNNIYVAIQGNPLTKSSTDLTKAEELLEEFFNRSGKTKDYKGLYNAFLKKQHELAVEDIKKRFADKDEKSLVACTINGPHKGYREEAKSITDLEELRMFITNLYIDAEIKRYQEQFENFNNE
jgi:hypothetical protein